MAWDWDLTYLYHGFEDPAFREDMAALPKLNEDLKALLAQELPPREKLERLLQLNDTMEDKLNRLFSLCQLTLSVNATHADAAKAMDQLLVLANDLSLTGSMLTRYVGSIPNLEEVIASSPALTEVGFALRQMAQQCSHMIPESIEPWILEMQLSGGNAFSQLRDKLDGTHLVSYRGQELPLSAVRAMAYDPDPEVRKDAYEAEIAAYRKIELPMSFCLNSIKMEARTLAKAQGYGSVLEMTLADSRMDQETLDAMWTAIQEYLPHFRRYLKAKGKYLGHANGLPFYDLFAPVGKAGKTYTVEQAREKLVSEMSKFTPAMGEFIDHAFEAHWIDMFPKEGKSGGAFCSSLHSADRSSILTNFQGSFSDVSTLAHELGHAWHARQMAGLPLALTHEPMPLAETASIFNETLLSHLVLQQATEEERFTLLESSLMEATQTVVDIYSRYLFESDVVETRADHSMSVDELKDAMLRAQDAAYGDGLDPAVRHPYMWACKSHYYSSGLNFYNFPYAFGLLFGKGVFAQYLEKGESFVPVYNQLLRSCGSDTIANVAASVGIDVRSVDFWRASLEIIKKDIDAFCDLCEKLA